MKRLLPALLFVALVTPVGAEDKKEPTKNPNKVTAFRTLSYDKALEAAKKDKKIVFIDFYADWCGPCKQLDAKTFSDGKVQKFLTDKAIAIKVDVDKQGELAKKYGVRAIPTMVFLNSEGKEIGKVVGFRDATKFLTEAEEIAKK